jgi:L-lactate dehydrogenase complex protein LldG
VTGAREEILARIRAAVGAGPDGRAGGNGRSVAGASGPARSEVAGAYEVTAAAGRAGSPAEADAAYAALPRPYLRSHHDPDTTDMVALFAERAADYRAFVERVPLAGLPEAVRVAVGMIRADTAQAGGTVPQAGGTVPQAGGTVPQAGAMTSDGSLAKDAIRLLIPDGLPGEWLTELPEGLEMVRDEPVLSAGQLDRVSGVVTGCAVAVAETGTVILDHGPGQGRRALTLVPDFHLVVVQAGQIAADLPDALAMLDPARPHTLVSGPSATSDIELIRVEGVHGPRVLYILIAD